MPVSRRLQSKVLAVVDHGEHVYSVALEPRGPTPRFIPGQFLHLALDPVVDGGFWPESRVFSIASAPHDTRRLAITYAVKGAFTSRMERELTPGRDVWVKLPFGSFQVDTDRDAVLIAGGTGITAFVSFLGSLPPDYRRRVLLLYGARSDALFVYRDQIEAQERLVQSLSCDLVAEDVRGRLAIEPAWAQISMLAEPLFYLSGPPGMIGALTRQLHDRHIPAESVRTDAWE